MAKEVGDAQEIIYQALGDTLQVWLSAGGPSVNRHVSDGLYEIRDLGTDELLGYEIVDFVQGFAPKHEGIRQFADRLVGLHSEEVILRQVDSGELRQLIP